MIDGQLSGVAEGPGGLPALSECSLLAEEERHPELLNLFKTRIVEPRRALLRQALAAGGLPDFVDLDALTSMLIGSILCSPCATLRV